MLKSLKFEGLGPSDAFGPVEFASRLNFITGDNGLGKSFLLDIAWWTLTRTWARNSQAAPRRGAERSSIDYAYTKATPGAYSETSIFNREGQFWPVKPGRPPIPGVVIYAGVDGSFSVWDPARNYWTAKEDAANRERLRAFDFSPDQVWNGLVANGTRYCNGLIHDWVLWQKGRDPAFGDLVKVLDALSPAPDERLEPGDPVRIGLDVTDYPSLRMPYGQDVPLIHASAGMRRITALAYLMVWTWREHLLASEQIGKAPAKEIVFLVDEIECHLHPQWQRRIVPALLNVMQALTGKQIPVQLIVATHSPLILASAEPAFDVDQDAVFTIALRDGQAVVEQEVWAKQGDVVNWLVSDAFGLRQARSVEAERAIEAAEAFMRGEHPVAANGLDSKESIHKALTDALPGGDHFWPRWIVWTESRDCVG